MENINNVFNTFQFPRIKDMSAKSISDEIKAVKPMSLEDAANGRPIKPYPIVFDDFASIEELKDFIEIKLKEESMNVKPEWLKASDVISMPLNTSEDVYYTSVRLITVGWVEPEEGWISIINGGTFCRLDPDKWNIDDINNAVSEIYQKLKK